MKKFAILSLAAAAALTLSACGGDGAANNAAGVDNEIVLNSEEAPLDNLAEEPATTDNADSADNTVVDNTLEASNASVDLNSTALNTAE